MRGWGYLVMLMMVWGCSLTWALWKGGTASWFLCYSLGCLLAYIVCFQWVVLRTVKVSVIVENENYTTHDDVWVTATVQHKSWVPLLWLVIEQEWVNSTRSHVYKYRQVFYPWLRHFVQSSRRMTAKYNISHVKRGQYHTNSVRLITGDVFGFTTKSKQALLSSNFKVFPRPLEIHPEFISLRSGSDGALKNTHSLNIASQFSSVRDYASGDPMNRIHWKSTARSQDLKTKEMDVMSEKQCMVFLDGEQQAYLSESPVALFEKSVQVTASLLKFAQDHHYETGFLCSNKREWKMPLSSQFSLQKAYSYLADVNPDGNSSFQDVLWREADQLPKETLLLCVTAKIDDVLLQTVQQLCARRLHVGIIYIYSAAALSWHQQFLKKQFEALGCLFYSVQYTDMEWSEQRRSEYAGA